jgi:[acyl-carrier-protein] S-malonyltransferase
MRHLTAPDLRSVALVFPGQGSHENGMREEVEHWAPDLLETLARAAEGDVFAELESSTASAQPAVVCASIAYWQALGRPRAGFVVGHSLGELTALVAAGCLDGHDAIRLAARRGALMQAASDAHPGCGMLAVRAPLQEVEPIARDCGLVVGNHNAPSQIVLSGGPESLECARARLRGAGLRATPLRVAGAFHSPLMRSAVEPFRVALRHVELAPPRNVVYSAITAQPMTDPRRELPQSLVSRVRWVETIEALVGAGVQRFVEVGPGGVLSRLIDLTLGRTTAPRGDAGPSVPATLQARELI